MLVQKTLHHRVVTLAHGPVRASETVRMCASGCTLPSGARLTRRSDELRRLVPAGGVFGYDIEVAVGLARFVRHQQREEIRAELQGWHGIVLSGGEISALAARFALHLQALHQAKAEDIRAALADDDGYPLHVDATGEDGRGTLFVAYAGWRHWVLGAWKLPTENAEAMVPHLQGVLRDFGVPRAVVRDLGRAVSGAVTTVLAPLPTPVPVLACHQHFLRDIGTDLLKADYDRLRALFRDLGVRATLGALVRDLGRRLGGRVPALRTEVQQWAEQKTALPTGTAGLAVIRALGQWVLDYANDGRHQGFPFDRPYLDLYHRCLDVCRASARLVPQARRDRALRAALERLRQTLRLVQAEVAFGQVTRRLEARCRLFDELRAVLRLDRLPAPTDSLHYDNRPEETPAALQDIEQSFQVFVHSLRSRRAAPRLARGERQALDLVLDHLDRHGRFLWGHVLRSHDAQAVRVVARTNNVLEGFFHRVKHGERRRSGRKVLTQDFEGLPAAAALAYNLTKPDYLALLCGDLDGLADKFSALDAARRETAAMIAVPATPTPPQTPALVTAALPLADRRLIRQPVFRQRLAATARR